jgi:hypothetical protein
MSRFSLRVRDYTHDGEGRLMKLRQSSKAANQLRKTIAESHDEPRPSTKKLTCSVTGVA